MQIIKLKDIILFGFRLEPSLECTEETKIGYD